MVGQVKGTVQWRDEADLRKQDGVAMCRMSDNYGMVRLWIALNAYKKFHKISVMFNQ